MTTGPDVITVTIRPDISRFRASAYRAVYQVERLAHLVMHGARAVDTPALIDSRDTAYALTDLATDPGPFLRQRDTHVTLAAITYLNDTREG